MAFTPSDLIVWDEFSRSAAWARYNENINLFNAATKNTLTIQVADLFQGFTKTDSLFRRLSPEAIIRRDPKDNDTVMDVVQMAQDFTNEVKFGSTTKPLLMDTNWYEWAKINIKQAGIIYGEMIGELIAIDAVNTSINTLLAGITALGTTATLDISAAATGGTSINYTAMLDLKQLYGDQAGLLQCWLVHSQVFTDLIKQNLINKEQLFSMNNVTVYSDLTGVPIVVADNPAFKTVTAGDTPVTTYTSLCLPTSSVTLRQTTLRNEVGNTGIDKLNTGILTKSVWESGISLRGMRWKGTADTAPTNAQLQTATNWEQIPNQFLKDTCGLRLITAPYVPA